MSGHLFLAEVTMTNPLDPMIALPLAAVLALAAIVIWYALVRPVPERQGRGVIVGSETFPAGRVNWTQARIHRSLEYVPKTERRYLAERTVYRIRLKDRGLEVRFAVPTGGEMYPLGQEVEVMYFERTLPGVWSRAYVKGIKPLS